MAVSYSLWQLATVVAVTTVCGSQLQCVAVSYSLWQSATICDSQLQFVAVSYSLWLLATFFGS